MRVSPGLLVDQFGRDTVIRCPQCARLGQWLTARLYPAGDDRRAPRSSGVLTVYVVARYDQCLDTFVPLPVAVQRSDELAVRRRIKTPGRWISASTVLRCRAGTPTGGWLGCCRWSMPSRSA